MKRARSDKLATKGSLCVSAGLFRGLFRLKIDSVRQTHRECRFRRVVVMEKIHCFLDPKFYEPLYLPPHVIHKIFRF